MFFHNVTPVSLERIVDLQAQVQGLLFLVPDFFTMLSDDSVTLEGPDFIARLCQKIDNSAGIVHVPVCSNLT